MWTRDPVHQDDQIEGGDTSHTSRHSRKPQHVSSSKKTLDDREVLREEKEESNSMNVSVDWGVLSSRNGLLIHPLEALKKEGENGGSRADARGERRKL